MKRKMRKAPFTTLTLSSLQQWAHETSFIKEQFND